MEWFSLSFIMISFKKLFYIFFLFSSSSLDDTVRLTGCLNTVNLFFSSDLSCKFFFLCFKWLDQLWVVMWIIETSLE